MVDNEKFCFSFSKPRSTSSSIYKGNSGKGIFEDCTGFQHYRSCKNKSHLLTTVYGEIYIVEYDMVAIRLGYIFTNNRIVTATAAKEEITSFVWNNPTKTEEEVE